MKHPARFLWILFYLLALPLIPRPAPGADATDAAPDSAFAAPDTTAQAPPGQYLMAATRLLGPAPDVDGRLDDEAWRQASPIDTFIQHEPDEGKPATERTEARILCDDYALYVGIQAFDREPEQIVGLLTRRDEDSKSDWLGVSIDSFGDRRTAFTFLLNPAGVERDVYHFDDTAEDVSWDAVWEGAARIDGAGWAAELRIPFNQLRFAARRDRPWGFEVVRIIARRNEKDLWKPIARDSNRWVSEYGELAGVEGVAPSRRLELLPYTLGGGEIFPREDGNPFADGRDLLGRAGLDLKYGITSDITLDAAFNPDFGQVEADPSVLNLSEFETFFSEKRPFFLEGSDKFNYSLNLGDGGTESIFYTRRIGRTPQGDADGDYVESPLNTTILGSGKISGKTASGWTVGLIEAVTQEEQAEIRDAGGGTSEQVIEPLTNYTVGRVSRDMRGGESAVGGIFTATHRRLEDTGLDWLHDAAYAGGVDARHRFNNAGWAVNGRFAASHVRGEPAAILRDQRSSRRFYQRPDVDHVEIDSTATDLTGTFGYLEAGKFSGTWRGALLSQYRSPGFEVNDLGFQRQADDINNVLWLGHRRVKPALVFRNYGVNLNLWYRQNFADEPTARGGNVNGSGQLLNYWGVWGGVDHELEALHVRALRGGPAMPTLPSWNAWAGFHTDTRKKVWSEQEAWFWRDNELTRIHGGYYQVTVRAAPNVNLSVGQDYERLLDDWFYVSEEEANGEPQYMMARIDQHTISLTTRVNWTFRPTLSLQVYASPFLSAGKFNDFKRVVDARAKRYDDRFDHLGEVGGGRLNRVDDETFEVDIDQNGAADFSFDDPAFNFRELRSNVVLRWEYLQGSTMFLVYQHARSHQTLDGASVPFRDFGELWEADGTHTFLVKVNYWWSL
jgi:hypothetical protein